MKAGYIVVIGLVIIGAFEMMRFLNNGLLASYQQIDETRNISLEDINEVRVNMSDERIHIFQNGAGKEVELRYYGNSQQDISLVTEQHGKTLVIEAHGENHLISHRISLLPEDLHLDIYLPQDYTEILTLDTSSGAVITEELHLENFHLQISSGKLDSEGLYGGQVFVKSSSGKIKIKNLEADKVDLEGNSSAIVIEKLRAQNGRLQSNSGRIVLDESAGDLNLKTNSGSINLEDTVGNLEARSASGSISISYREYEDEEITLKASSGRISLNLPPSAEFKVEARMNSGHFKTDFSMNYSENNTSGGLVKGQVGNHENHIDLQTSSGSIYLMKN